MAIALARALWPDPFTEPVIGQIDKLVHAAAFYGLVLFAAAAYPRTTLPILAASMLGFGVLIEVLQAIPAIHRDASGFDLLADLVGITLALTPTVIPAVRQSLKR